MQTPGLKQAETKPILSRRITLRFLFLLITRRRRHCTVVGNSMLPTLKQGDIVIYRPITSGQSSPKRGCIVVAKDPLDLQSLIIKRVHQENPLGLELRGDNVKSSIDSRKFGLVNHSYIYGIVEHVISSDP